MKEKNTSDRLREIMTSYGLRQVDILKKTIPFCKKYNVKLGRNDLSQYISGKVEPSQKKLTVLAEALNVDEVWLMGYDVPINNTNNLSFNFSPEWTLISIDYKNIKNIIEKLPKDVYDLLNLNYKYREPKDNKFNFGFSVFSNIDIFRHLLIDLNIIKTGILMSDEQIDFAVKFICKNKNELNKILVKKYNDFLKQQKELRESKLYNKFIEELKKNRY